MRRLSQVLSLILIVALPIVIGCEGPSGTEGPQGPEGPEGPEGPVGPAGEDGSMIYSGQGAPDADIGEIGDYYLDTDTGEMYGPKDSDGWGNPIIVLMGEDGADGEDGSQIHSGSGTPDASLGAVGDYYLDEDNYDLYGPKTDSGWGTPLNLKGADGNANVTRYLYPGHDFRDEASGGDGERAEGCIEDINEEEVSDYALLYYLENGDVKYSIPGWGAGGVTEYRAFSQYSTNTCDNGMLWRIERVDGSGEEYDPIEIVQIETSNTVDNRKQKSDSIIPDHLNFSDYEVVAEYYNFYSEK